MLKDLFELTADIEALYLLAFPEQERRILPAQRQLLQDGALRLAEVNNGRFAGFIFYWRLSDFVFIEHFAIAEVQRGAGIGTAVMQLLFEQHARLVLEVEPPYSTDAVRRIRFYESLGFAAWEHSYLQPSYVPGGQPVPMLLMGKGMPREEHTFHIVTSEIYREVYGI